MGNITLKPVTLHTNELKVCFGMEEPLLLGRNVLPVVVPSGNLMVERNVA